MEILELITNLRVGGAQRVAANVSEYAPESFHFTYLVFDEEIGEYEAEIFATGNEVVHIPSPKKGYILYLKALWKQMHARSYDVVHCHNMYSCGLVMLAATCADIPGKISHSHTAKDNILLETFPRKAYKRVMRGLIWSCSTEYLACGEDAGEELYGKRYFEKHGVVIKNGIDTAAYRFNAESRRQIREKYGLGDRFVIGHVGHYVEVKNQFFLIRMIPEILKRRSDVVLLLFGEGDNRVEMQAEIDRLGLNDSVRLMGNVSNIPQVMSAFDVFAFPSLLEGTPLALLEAQANGLPCVISDTIPDDACVTDLIRKLPLSDSVPWAEAILTAKRNMNTDYTSVLSERYGDVHDSMAKLYGIFEKYNRGR